MYGTPPKLKIRTGNPTCDIGWDIAKGRHTSYKSSTVGHSRAGLSSPQDVFKQHSTTRAILPCLMGRPVYPHRATLGAQHGTPLRLSTKA
eukprot:5436629-Amphidinium_carterae.1